MPPSLLRPRSLILLFPGQGSQRVGMCADLYRAHAGARYALDEVESALGASLRRTMFEGPPEALAATATTQPALFAHSLAALASLQALCGGALLRPASSGGVAARGLVAVAGHSVGEYAALAAAGSLSVGDGTRLLRTRGRTCAAAAAAYTDATGDAVRMSALTLGSAGGEDGLDSLVLPSIRRACEEAVARLGGASSGGRTPPPVAAIAAVNSPTQVVLSGSAAAVDAASASLRGGEAAAGAGGAAAAGGTPLVRRVTNLAVSAPFHSPIMAPAAAAVGRLLGCDGGARAHSGAVEAGGAQADATAAAALPREAEEAAGSVRLAPPLAPLVAGVSAAALEAPAALGEALTAGITAPVLWLRAMRAAAALAGGAEGSRRGEAAPLDSEGKDGGVLFLELGAGGTLTALLRQCLPPGMRFHARAVGTAAELDALARELGL